MEVSPELGAVVAASTAFGAVAKAMWAKALETHLVKKQAARIKALENAQADALERATESDKSKQAREDFLTARVAEMEAKLSASEAEHEEQCDED